VSASAHIQDLPIGLEAEDPELLSLPSPPKRERSLLVGLLGFTALVCTAMAVSLSSDAAFAFAQPIARNLGELATAPAEALEGAGFVRGHGLVGAGGAIRYERPLQSDTFRAVPVAGRPDVWIELRLPAGAESGRYVPPAEFQGRLVRLDEAGPRHRGLRSAIEATTGQKLPAKAWLLVDGESPKNSRWAVMLVAMFGAFAAWNAGAIRKLLARVK